MTSAAAQKLQYLSTKIAQTDWLKLVSAPQDLGDGRNPLSARHIFQRQSTSTSVDSQGGVDTSKVLLERKGSPLSTEGDDGHEGSDSENSTHSYDRAPLSARISLSGEDNTAALISRLSAGGGLVGASIGPSSSAQDDSKEGESTEDEGRTSTSGRLLQSCLPLLSGASRKKYSLERTAVVGTTFLAHGDKRSSVPARSPTTSTISTSAPSSRWNSLVSSQRGSLGPRASLGGGPTSGGSICFRGPSGGAASFPHLAQQTFAAGRISTGEPTFFPQDEPAKPSTIVPDNKNQAANENNSISEQTRVSGAGTSIYGSLSVPRDATLPSYSTTASSSPLGFSAGFPHINTFGGCESPPQPETPPAATSPLVTEAGGEVVKLTSEEGDITPIRIRLTEQDVFPLEPKRETSEFLSKRGTTPCDSGLLKSAVDSVNSSFLRTSSASPDNHDDTGCVDDASLQAQAGDDSASGSDVSSNPDPLDRVRSETEFIDLVNSESSSIGTSAGVSFIANQSAPYGGTGGEKAASAKTDSKRTGGLSGSSKSTSTRTRFSLRNVLPFGKRKVATKVAPDA